MLNKIRDNIRNEESIRRILETMGCEFVNKEQRGFLITAQLPDKFNSSNKRAVQVKLNNKLNCNIRNKSDFKGDIFSLISYIKFDKRDGDIAKNLTEARDFICKIFNWNDFMSSDDDTIVVKDFTSNLRELVDENWVEKVIPNEVLPEEVLEDYLDKPSWDWKKEGISYKTQNIYGIGFDLYSKRITVPIRNEYGELVGVKARILKDEDDDRKYIYLYPCNNSQEWFNYYIAKDAMEKEKVVYIFEGEKSCMKMYENNIYNSLAIGSSDISEVQAHTLSNIEDLKVVLCYDKDKTTEDIKDGSETLYEYNINTYSLYDVNNLLNEKDSPIDRGIDVFKALVENNCYKIF